MTDFSSKTISTSEKIIAKIDALEITLVSLKKVSELAVNEIKTLKKQSQKILLKQQKKRIQKPTINHMDSQFLLKFQKNCVFL